MILRRLEKLSWPTIGGLGVVGGLLLYGILWVFLSAGKSVGSNGTASGQDMEGTRTGRRSDSIKPNSRDYQDLLGKLPANLEGEALQNARLAWLERVANEVGLMETIDLIEKELGIDSDEGSVLIDQLLLGWAEKDRDFVKILERPELEKGRLRFVKEVMQRLFFELDMEAKSFEGISDLSETSQALYGHLLAQNIDLNDAVGKQMDEIFKILGDSNYGEGMADSFFRNLIWRGPSLAWEQAVEWKQEGNDLSQDTVNELASRVFDDGFEESMEKISSSSEVMGLEVLGVAFERWVDLEVDQATGWFEENKAKFKQAELDTFAVAFARSAQVRDEYDAAWEWVGQVNDPERRQEIFDKVRTREREVILNEAKIDPQGTLGDLVSKGSVHPGFWIKEAFAEWNRSDSKNAAKWYADNREVLTPDQNQHVARAYAEEAVAIGDLEKAREWAGQVIDPDFLGTLRKQISEAEQK